MSTQAYDNAAYTSQPTQGQMAQPAMPAQPGYGQPQMEQPGYGQPAGPAQPGYGQPQMNQPGAPPGYQQAGAPGAPGGNVQWMPKPEAATGVPPGLEYLSQIDQLLVKQKVELLEAFTGWETSNKYSVNNAMGQQVYYAAEESDACSRQCCGPARGFVMHITDNFGKEVIRVNRNFKCCAGCQCCAAIDCCAFEVEIEAPVGTPCAYVKQKFSCLAPKYAILNANREETLIIEGPMCVCNGPCCPFDQEFNITSPNTGEEVGKISKQYSGFAKEMFTDADNFGISFPNDLDVRVKAACLGAVFLIDFMFFEQNDNGNH